MRKRAWLWMVLAVLAWLCAPADAQMRIVINEADSTLTLMWRRVTTDTLGGPEVVKAYSVYTSYNGGPYLWVGVSTAAALNDTSSAAAAYTLPKLQVPGRYTFGVVAEDAAGNRSKMHVSTDASAFMGGWALEWDVTPPQMPSGLVPGRGARIVH